MKNKSDLSQDDLRQKIDGFSFKHDDEKEKSGYKIGQMPLYPTHSLDYEDIKDK